MTVIDEFYEAYLHYSVALRLWMDTCRQLATCKGTLEERQALTDESLRLTMCVSDYIDETELLIGDTLEYIQSSDNPDTVLLEAISLIINNLKEDRARTDDYNKFVTRRRAGGKEKRPRRPQIANPFVFEEESDGEAIADTESHEDIEETSSEEQVDDRNPLATESDRMADEQKE